MTKLVERTNVNNVKIKPSLGCLWALSKLFNVIDLEQKSAPILENCYQT
jgi:hypothetical protein